MGEEDNQNGRADFTLLHAEVGQELEFGPTVVTVYFSAAFLCVSLAISRRAVLEHLGLAEFHGTGAQEFLDILFISYRKSQTESSCFHSHCTYNYVSLYSVVDTF